MEKIYTYKVGDCLYDNKTGNIGLVKEVLVEVAYALKNTDTPNTFYLHQKYTNGQLRHEDNIIRLFHPEAYNSLKTENEKLCQIINAWINWEAEFLNDDKIWQNGLPVFTQEMFNKYLELQKLRKETEVK